MNASETHHSIDVERPKFRRKDPLREATTRDLGEARDKQLLQITERLCLYKEIFAASKEGIAIISPEGLYLEQNQAHRELLGYTDEELIDKTPAVHLGEENFVRICRGLEREGRWRGELASRTKAGRDLIIDISAFSIRDAEGQILCHVGIKRDVTERKQAEQVLARRAAEQAALYQFADRQNRAASLAEVYDAALDSILSALNCDRASILLLDETGVMRFVGWRGLSGSYRQAVEGHSPWSPEEKDPAPICIEDIDLAEIPEALRELVHREGIRALAFIPLVVNGQLRGKFMAYYDAPHRFTPEDLSLGLTVARQLGFGIDQKRAEKALRESESRFRSVVNSVEGIVWECAVETDGFRFTLVSEKAEELLGYPVAEWLSDRNFWPAHIHPDDRDWAVKFCASRTRERQDHEFEYRMVAADGRVVWLHDIVTVITESNEALKLVGVMVDVSERKRAEGLLDAQKGTLEKLVRGAPLRDVLGSLVRIVEQRFEGKAIASILLLDEEGRLRNGASPSLPEDYVRAIDGLKAHAELGTCGRAAATGEPVITPDIDADPRWKAIKHLPLGLGFRAAWSLPILAKDGRVLGTFGTYFRECREPSAFERQVVEILARTAALAIEGKSAEEALRRSEAQFRLLSETLPQIVWTARPDGYVDYGNKRWSEFTGLSEREIGESWVAVLHPDDMERSVQSWSASVRAGRPYEIEYRLKDRQGTFRWFLGRALPLRDDSGKVIRWFGTCTDIDDQKRAAEKLEQAVADRTASLREAIAQMEEFSYTVSHDLRAPLRGMHAYTQALLEDYGSTLPGEATSYLKRIESNAERLDRMILDVLTFSRVARSGITLERVGLDRLVRQIVEQYPNMQPPHAHVQIEPLPDVLGHEPSLTQALSNLLNNAVKFVSPDVTPQVHVRAERRSGCVRLWIEDNGIGISPRYQHRLFNMFERVHPNLAYEGTGVGLAIVRKAVERMGGSAGVESDGVNGSRFWLELRASDERV